MPSGSCDIVPLDSGQHKIDVKMSMTAPGCGMGKVLKADVENKLARLPTVEEVHVEVVFDPPWDAGRMSEPARLHLALTSRRVQPHLRSPSLEGRSKNLTTVFETGTNSPSHANWQQPVSISCLLA